MPDELTKRPRSKAGGRAKLDGRTKAARLLRDTRAELAGHVGGNPTAAQAMLIGRIAWLRVHLQKIDEGAMRDGGLSPHAAREYLAWSNTTAKLLARLGLKAAPAPQLTLAEHLARRAAETRASAPAAAGVGI